MSFKIDRYESQLVKIAKTGNLEEFTKVVVDNECQKLDKMLNSKNLQVFLEISEVLDNSMSRELKVRKAKKLDEI